MSCEHGNWAPCDECEALEGKFDSGYAAGARHADRLKSLLRECDAAIVMLGGAYAAKKLRDEIASAFADMSNDTIIRKTEAGHG